MAPPVSAGVNLVVTGSASFTAAINNATSQLNKFGAEAVASSQRAEIQQEKLEARLQATQARLASLQDSLAKNSQSFVQNAATIADAQQQLAVLDARWGSLSNLQAKVTSYQNSYNAAVERGTTSSLRSAGGYLSQINRLQPILDVYSQLQPTIDKATSAQGREAEAIRYATAQVAVKTARIRELEAQLGTLGSNQKSTSFFQSFKDYIQRATSSADAFISEVDRISRVIDRLSTSSGRIMRQVNQIWQSITGKPLFDPVRSSAERAGPALEKTNAQFQQLVEKAGPLAPVLQRVPLPLQNISVAAIAAGTAIGHILADAIESATQALMNFGREAYNAVGTYELLSHSLQFMAANELRDKDATLSMDAAMGQAAGHASNLLAWIQQLGIRSPFSATQIQSTLQLAMGFGFTSDQAVRLIQDTVDLAAATGRGADVVERLVLNMGQINATGKLTGRELRDLAFAGFPVAAAFETIGKMMGKTKEEVQAMEQDGLIPANIAMEGIARTMEERAGGAALKMSGTLKGLTESLSDIATVTLRNLFGHLNTDTLQVEGALGALQKRILTLVEFLQGDAAQMIATGVGKSFGNLAENAFTWGENLVIQFANGMVAGMGALVNALSSIGNLIAYWLAPGSPPRLLPDLDKWGLGAMLAYMDGWNDVQRLDFSTIGDTIEQLLRSLPKTILPELDLAPTVAAMRASLTSLLSGAGSMSGFLSSMGGAGTMVEGFVTAMLNLDKANKAVAESQKKVDDITAMYDERLDSLNSALKKNQDAQQDMADEKTIRKLTRIANDQGASEARRHAAQLQLEEIMLRRKIRNTEDEKTATLKTANAQLDADKKKQALAQNAFNQQKQLIEVIIKQNQLTTEQINLVDKLNKENAVKGGGGAGGGAGLASKLSMPEFGGVSPNVDKVKSELEGVLLKLWILVQFWGTQIQATWNTVWDAIEARLQPVKDAWKTVEEAWSNLSATIGAKGPAINAVIAQIIAILIGMVIFWLPKFLNQIAAFLNEVAALWRDHGETIMSVIGFIMAVMLILIMGGMSLIVDAVRLAVAILSAIMTFLSTDWHARWEEIRLNAIGEFYSVLAFIQRTAGQIKEAVTTKIKEIKEWLETKWDQIKTKVSETWESIKTKVEAELDLVKTAVSTKVGEAYNWLVAQVTMWKTAGGNLIDGIKDGVVEGAARLLQAVIDAVAAALEAAKNFLDSKSPSKRAAKEIGTPFMQGVAQGMADAFPGVRASLGIMMGSLVHPVASPSQMGSMSVNTTNVQNYNYSPTYSSAPSSPARDFGLMRALR